LFFIFYLLSEWILFPFLLLISAFKLPASRCKMPYVAYVFMCLYGKIPVYSTEIFYITIAVILWKSYTTTAVCTAFDLIHDKSPAFINSQHSTPMMPGIRQTYFGTSISIFFSFSAISLASVSIPSMDQWYLSL